MEKRKTISEMLEDIGQEICESRCKYWDSSIVMSDGEYEKFMHERCDDCPLMKL